VSGRGAFCFVFPSLPSVSSERKRYVFCVLSVVGCCCCCCFFPFSFCRGIRGLGFESRNLEVYEVAGCVSFGMQFSSLGLVFSGRPGGRAGGIYALSIWEKEAVVIIMCGLVCAFCI
jgi:hypothetical protein